MDIVSTADPDDAAWLTLRSEFIPEIDPAEQRSFLQAFARDSASFRAFVATDPQAGLLGFAEVAVRTDFVNGCHHRPALFLEGIFVRPEHRGLGLGRLLARRVVEEGRKLGYRSMRLDTLDRLEGAIALYRSMGFRTTAPYYLNPLSGAMFWEKEL